MKNQESARICATEFLPFILNNRGDNVSYVSTKKQGRYKPNSREIKKNSNGTLSTKVVKQAKLKLLRHKNDKSRKVLSSNGLALTLTLQVLHAFCTCMPIGTKHFCTFCHVLFQKYN